MTSTLLPRAVLAFVLLPGTFAFLIPLTLLAPDLRTAPFHISGWILVGLGTFLLLWCVRDFYVAGTGTLAPWAPPRDLVTSGLYRYSRNPMYVAVLLILAGWAAGFQSRALALYALAVAAAFHVRVILNEEPYLARTHGERWERYKSAVPRWLS